MTQNNTLPIFFILVTVRTPTEQELELAATRYSLDEMIVRSQRDYSASFCVGSPLALPPHPHPLSIRVTPIIISQAQQTYQ